MIRRYFYAVLQRIKTVRLRMLHNDGTVLMFHEISRIESADYAFGISLESLENLIKYYIGNVIFDSVDNIDVKNNNSRQRIFITFDDAYEGVYTLAYPFLKENNIPFTVFMSDEYLDKEGYLTTDMLRELAEYELCTVGMHLHHHIMARNLSDDELEHEITDNKNTLERICGKKPDLLAFPYGSSYAVSGKNIETAKKYAKTVFLTWNSHINSEYIQRNRTVPRISINEEIARRIIGGHPIS